MKKLGQLSTPRGLELPGIDITPVYDTERPPKWGPNGHPGLYVKISMLRDTEHGGNQVWLLEVLYGSQNTIDGYVNTRVLGDGVNLIKSIVSWEMDNETKRILVEMICDIARLEHYPLEVM